VVTTHSSTEPIDVGKTGRAERQVLGGWSQALLQVRYCGRPLFEDDPAA
jgi:hypothetical protein